MTYICEWYVDRLSLDLAFHFVHASSLLHQCAPYAHTHTHSPKQNTKNVRKSNKILHTYTDIRKKVQAGWNIENHIVFGRFYYLIKSYDYFFYLVANFFFFDALLYILVFFLPFWFSMWTHINMWLSKKVLFSSIQNYQQVNRCECCRKKHRVSNAI